MHDKLASITGGMWNGCTVARSLTPIFSGGDKLVLRGLGKLGENMGPKPGPSDGN